MSKKTYISEPKNCDFCPSHAPRTARYDFKTSWGPWANGCEIHWRTNRAHTELGTGYGQELVVGDPPERTDDDIRKEAMAAIIANDFDAFEDAIGDRDPAEFL